MQLRAWFALVLPVLLACQGSPAQEPPGQLRSRGGTLQVVESDRHDLDLRTTPVVRAVQKAADSVVSIYILNRNHLAGGVPATEGQGSGVILDEGGFVITNWHVVAPVLLADGYHAQVRQRDGAVRPARVLSSSPAHDLALLQMELPPGEKTRPVEVGRSAGLMIGETVVAIGNPQGHANTVTSGVLSAIGRTIRVRAPDGVVREYTDLLQTDAAINQGNSGGALLDITGKLVGINNAMAMGAENIGFAIPVDTVRRVFEDELTRSASYAAGGLDNAWLGLRLEDTAAGLVVADVWPGGPAALAGVKPGDVIVEVASREVRTALDYVRRTLSAQPGQAIPLTVLRGGRRQELAPSPTTRLAWTLTALVGLGVEEVTAEQDPQLLQRATRAFYSGTPYRRVPLLPVALRVVRVDPDSPAASLGIRPGDVILAVVGVDPRFRVERDIRLDSLRDLVAQVAQRAGASIKLLVLRGDEDLVGTLEVRRAAVQDYR